MGSSAIALTGSLFSNLTDVYFMMLITRILAGIGEGGLLALSSAMLAGSTDPDRAYGRLSALGSGP